MGREKLDNYLDAHARVQDIYKLINENYFKRTQLFMTAIQGAFLISFVSFIGSQGSKSLILLMIIPILGGFLAFTWYRLGIKQSDYLEYCKCYLRNLELCLEKLGVPLTFQRHEAIVFKKKDVADFQWRENVIGKDGLPDDDDELEYNFPYKKRIGKVKGGMTTIENRVAFGTICFWIAMFLLVLWNIHGSCPDWLKLYQIQILETLQ